MSNIHLKQLTVSYGSHQVIRDITLDLPERRIIAIIGPSGCGKTTLLKSINRLLDLNEDVRVEGDICIDGMSIYSNGTDVIDLRKKVGFLSQRPYPLPMSIYDNVAFGPRIHKLDVDCTLRRLSEHETFHHTFDECLAGKSPDRRKGKGMALLVEYYLRLAGLWGEVKDRLHAPASKLSIGQQQRLALARVLAIEPEVILADEPTSALDPISAKLVEARFKLLKQDYTIIVVTHILRQARRLADYIVFLYMGDLVEHGPSEQFFGDPQDEKTRAYISGEIS
ncbi:MAG: phosphate ABC transporter membrane subunit PstB [Syntrophus sp. SKADARSKE-3]|nr:phosphate ABC transporter membrane subunit PstB [Syntrophus sp. SKADARSKE-3]